MRAVVYERYGPPDVLQIRELPEPVATRNTVRIQVHATALNPKDVLLRKGRMRWLPRGRPPWIPGYDLAGVLLDGTPDLPAGTRVMGMIDAHAGGACASIVALPPEQFCAVPAGLALPDAAGIPLAGLTALQALRDELELRPGQTVLINGASGGVGTLAVQIARCLGATVTGVCSARNRERVLQLGAHHVVDYTTEDPAELRDLDAVFDVYGTLPWKRARPMLQRSGRYCTTIPRAGTILRGALRRLGFHRAALVNVRSRRRDLEQLATWLADGSLSPVTDQVLPLDQVAEAHRHQESRRARGKIVLTF